MSQYNFPSASTTLNVLSPVSAANTAAATSSGVDLLGYDAGPIVIIQHHGLSTGTLDGKIQDSADNSTWADVTGATFTQETTTVGIQKMSLDRKAVRRYIKYVGTVATGPAIVGVSATLISKIT
jgi:hypothetical protein